MTDKPDVLFSKDVLADMESLPGLGTLLVEEFSAVFARDLDDGVTIPPELEQQPPLRDIGWSPEASAVSARVSAVLSAAGFGVFAVMDEPGRVVAVIYLDGEPQ